MSNCGDEQRCTHDQIDYTWESSSSGTLITVYDSYVEPTEAVSAVPFIKLPVTETAPDSFRRQYVGIIEQSKSPL